MNKKRNKLIKEGFINWRTGRCVIILIFCLNLINEAQAQKKKGVYSEHISITDELRTLSDISQLPFYRTQSIVAQTSSYDTTGGNDDGFSGKYSYLRKTEDGNLVIFDVKGAGVINRIWTPTPTDDTLDFYIDNNATPLFSIKFSDLFSDKIFPFVAPLCGNELGGYYCYFPILFQNSCKIIFRGKKMQFYQIQYRLYPNETEVKKFNFQLDYKEKEALKHVAEIWNEKARSIRNFTAQYSGKIKCAFDSFKIRPGEVRKIVELNKGGRIAGIELNTSNDFKEVAKQMDIEITWDNERYPAIYCPIADFFGYAFGKPSMQSLLLGVQNNLHYCYFPMPFDKHAIIKFIYRNTNKTQQPVHLTTRVYYTEDKRDVKSEGKFYAHWVSEKESGKDGPHIFLNINGKGHYVGTILQAQGMLPGMTSFFEGDDSTAVDGNFRIHGTGSEDYFNGGWYALLDRWDTKMSLPIHGALDYSIPLARTGGYRLYLSDKISFEKSIFQSIEHGPTDNVPVYYTSLALYYCDSPVRSFTRPINELSKVYIPDTLIMYPQLMRYSMRGQVNFNFKGGIILTPENDESIVNIALNDIPYGRYRLYADLNKYRGGAFSIWQREHQLSAWIQSYKSDKEHISQLYLCEIDIGDFKNTLTLRFQNNETNKSLFLNRLILIRLKDAK